MKTFPFKAPRGANPNHKVLLIFAELLPRQSSGRSSYPALKAPAKPFPPLAKPEGTESRIFKHKTMDNFIWRRRFLIPPQPSSAPLTQVPALLLSFSVLRTAEAEAPAAEAGEGDEPGHFSFRLNDKFHKAFF